MTQKNDAGKKYLQAKTRVSREMYETKRKDANRVCRERQRERERGREREREKRIWINNKI
jgi:hypothetical protein